MQRDLHATTPLDASQLAFPGHYDEAIKGVAAFLGPGSTVERVPFVGHYVGIGGCTCNRPTSPQRRHSTEIGKCIRRFSSAAICASGSTVDGPRDGPDYC